MLTNYDTQEEFLGAVDESLIATGLDSGLREAIVDGVRQADVTLEEWEQQEDSGMEMRLGRWFIQNDDLPFFPVLGIVASTLVGLAATGGIAAPAMAGSICNLAAACWQVRRKGGNLTPEQVNVLGVLHTHKGLEVSDIVAELATLQQVTSAEDVRGTLESLTRLELYDGSEVAIVRRDEGGKWRALRV